MNARKEKQKRKPYSSEFKDQVLLRAEKEGVAAVAAELGIKGSLIYSWRAKKKVGGTTLVH